MARPSSPIVAVTRMAARRIAFFIEPLRSLLKVNRITGQPPERLCVAARLIPKRAHIQITPAGGTPNRAFRPFSAQGGAERSAGLKRYVADRTSSASAPRQEWVPPHPSPAGR